MGLPTAESMYEGLLVVVLLSLVHLRATALGKKALLSEMVVHCVEDQSCSQLVSSRGNVGHMASNQRRKCAALSLGISTSLRLGGFKKFVTNARISILQIFQRAVATPSLLSVPSSFARRLDTSAQVTHPRRLLGKCNRSSIGQT